jgi:hypothetical protein
LQQFYAFLVERDAVHLLVAGTPCFVGHPARVPGLWLFRILIASSQAPRLEKISPSSFQAGAV